MVFLEPRSEPRSECPARVVLTIKHAVDQKTLLLVSPAPVRRTNGRRYMESQAVNGLLRWSDNFNSLIATYVCYPEEMADLMSGVRWECIDGRSDLERITIVDLPYGYGPLLHFKFLGSIKETLRPLIAKSHYMSFAIGGYFGDWGSVAAGLATKQKRQFAVWTDRVESSVIRSGAKSKRNWIKKIYAIAYSWFVHWHERRVIRSASLGLFHGKDTFDAYSSCMKSSFNVLNIHLKNTDRIKPEDVLSKAISQTAGSRAFVVHDLHLSAAQRVSQQIAADKENNADFNNMPLRVGYAGRAADMKAPMDWLKVVHTVKEMGVDIRATWLGDGPLLANMAEFVKQHGLEEAVQLPGFIAEREHVVDALRSWDVLLFTHVTPESPRILLEAMVSATPIVGYSSSYARDLVSGFGERYLVPIGHTDELAEKLVYLHRNRKEWGRLVNETYAHSEEFNDVAVFKHRSDLIKKYL